MKKSIFIFCCFSLLSLGAFLNYEIQTLGDTQGVNLSFLIKNAYGNSEEDCVSYPNNLDGDCFMNYAQPQSVRIYCWPGGYCCYETQCAYGYCG